MPGAMVGYARVSTTEQEAGLAAQVAELTAKGCDDEHIFAEMVSGADTKRPKLQEALRFVRRGDTFIVTKPDRLARSLQDLLNIVQDLRDRGVNVKIISMDIDTGSSSGKLMLAMLAAFAEFERDIMLERQRAGIAAAKAEGKYKGRAPTARAQAERVLALKAEGKRPHEVVKLVGISRASYYRIVGESVT